MSSKTVTTKTPAHSTRLKDYADELVKNYHDLANIILKISEVYLYKARLDDALRLLNSDMLKDIEKDLMPKDKVYLQIQRAKIMTYKSSHNNGSFDAALEILLEAEKTAKALNDKGILADVVDRIGLALYSKELWNTTLETPLSYFRQGLALRRDINDERGIAESLFNIGLVYQNKTDADDDDRQKAFEYFQEAYSLAEAGNYNREKAHAARHIAYIYKRKGELDKALAYHKEFLVLNEEIGFKPSLSPAYVMVGVTYYEKNELDKAWKYFQSARTLAEEAGSKCFLAESLFLIGVVKEAKDDKDTALKYYQKGLAVAQSINFKRVIDWATERIENLTYEGSK